MRAPASCEHSRVGLATGTPSSSRAARRPSPVQRAFTLIEVALVIALVAMLSASAAIYFRAPAQVLGLSEAREQLSVIALLQHRRLLDTGAFVPVERVPSVVQAEPITLDSPSLRTLGFPASATATQLEVLTGSDARGPWFVAVARVQQAQLMELTLDSRDPREVRVRAVESPP